LFQVIHDCRADSVSLFSQFKITLRNVFDTQAAHAVLQFQTTGKPVHKVKDVSLNTLCCMYGLPGNPLKDVIKPIYKKDQRFWARRPLTRDMILYSAADVLCLVPALYSHFSRYVFVHIIYSFTGISNLRNLDLLKKLAWSQFAAFNDGSFRRFYDFALNRENIFENL